jgi:D-sedoheptulose 7-phosphate isomerase
MITRMAPRCAYPIKEFTSAYLASLCTVLDEVDLEAVERITQILRRARDDRATIFIAGNGGSASTASHWVNDLGKATKRSGRTPIRAMCLTDNTSWFSALANDEGYDSVFSSQLDNFAEPGDVLLVLSASGNSSNLIHAVALAQSRKVTTIGLLGFDGGKLKYLVDEMILVESAKGAYELVEDTHSAICHALTRCLIADRPEQT